MSYWAIVVDRRGRRRDERLVDDQGDGVRARGLATARSLIADDERLERVLPILDTLRATRRSTSSPSAATATCPTAPTAGPTSSTRRRTRPHSPTPTSTPTTTSRSSTRRGRPGIPKGAQLTHRGSVHNVMNIGFMSMVAGLAEAEGDRRRRRARARPAGRPGGGHPTGVHGADAAVPRDGQQLPAPAVHAWPAARSSSCTSGTPARALELIERERVTNFSGVPTMSREMLLHPDWALRDTSSLKGDGWRRRARSSPTSSTRSTSRCPVAPRRPDTA